MMAPLAYAGAVGGQTRVASTPFLVRGAAALYEAQPRRIARDQQLQQPIRLCQTQRLRCRRQQQLLRLQCAAVAGESESARSEAAMRMHAEHEQARSELGDACDACCGWRADKLQSLELAPIRKIDGHVKLPGSKSLSNRILLLAALAEGTTKVENLLVGTLATSLVALQKLFRALEGHAVYDSVCLMSGHDGHILAPTICDLHSAFATAYWSDLS